MARSMWAWFCAISLCISAADTAAASGMDSAQADALLSKIEALHWVHGPAAVRIGDQASISLSRGMRYLDAEETKHFLQLNGNPPSDDNYTLAPEKLTWFAIYNYEPAGYISDKEKIDPDLIFKQLKENEPAANERRKALGLSSMHVDRWTVAPHYDPFSHNLEWGTELHDDAGNRTINYTSRVLGRGGVMTAVLVSDPSGFSRDLPQYRLASAGFQYLPSRKYEEHQQGDKLAAYGLGALITGGAAAVAVKSGAAAGILAALAKFGAAFFKVIAVAVLGAFAALANWARGLFGRRKDT